MGTLYEAAGGVEGMVRLAEAWHARVMHDEVVSHAFSHGYHQDHTERLAAYWVEALGGPNLYSDRYGDESKVVRIHSGNGEHEEMDRRAIDCFDEAMVDVGISGDDRLRRALHDYFEWSTTTSMARYPSSADDVPDGLAIPRWSWDGLVVSSTDGTQEQTDAAAQSADPALLLMAWGGYGFAWDWRLPQYAGLATDPNALFTSKPEAERSALMHEAAKLEVPEIVALVRRRVGDSDPEVGS